MNCSAVTVHALELLAGSRWTFLHRAPGVRFMCTHQMATLFRLKWRHGRRLEGVTSYRKSDSVNGCTFTWGKVLPNFIPIQFETTEPWAFLKRSPNNKKKNKMSSDRRSVPDPKRVCEYVSVVQSRVLKYLYTHLTLPLPYLQGGCLRLDRHRALRPQHGRSAQRRQTSRSEEPLIEA